MKFNNMDSYNEKKQTQLFFIFIAIFSAIVAGYMILGLVGFITFLIDLVVLYWKWILGGLLVLVLANRFLRRKKAQ